MSIIMYERVAAPMVTGKRMGTITMDFQSLSWRFEITDFCRELVPLITMGIDDMSSINPPEVVRAGNVIPRNLKRYSPVHPPAARNITEYAVTLKLILRWIFLG